MIYIDEVTPVIEEKEDVFISGTALHYVLENWLDKFNEKYWIADWFLKDDLKDKILERFREKFKAEGKDEMDIKFELEAESKRLNKTTVTLPLLREEYYGTAQRSTIKNKVALTASEGRMVIGMYEALMKQPIMDVMNKYTKEQTITATYAPSTGEWELSIWTKPDRLCIYTTDENWQENNRRTFDEYMELVKDMSIQERSDYAKKNWVKGLFRDWKSTQSIAKMKKELIFDRETAFWYVFSMATYYTILYIATGIEFEARLDLVEKQEPFVTEAIALPNTFLRDKMFNEVLPTMKALLIAEKTGVYPEPSRKEILESKEMMKYYPHFANSVQSDVTYISDLMTDLPY